MTLGVNPDIAVFAKAMSNGYPMAAVIGSEDVMDAAQSTFMSSTSWTERIGPTAAIATIRKFIKENVAEHLIETGKLVQAGWQDAAKNTGIRISVSGMPPLSHFSFDSENAQILSTLFTQEMLKKGFLAWNQFKSCHAHKKEHVKDYLAATEETFALIADAQSKSNAADLLEGPPARGGFYRLTDN